MALPSKPFQTDKPPLLDINAPSPDDDSDIPYSGGSSAMFLNDPLVNPDKESTKKKEEQERKQRQQRSDLLPVAKDIYDFLDKERAAIADIRSYLGQLPPGTTGLQIKDEYRAREIYMGYLERFEAWMTNRLSKTPANKTYHR